MEFIAIFLISGALLIVRARARCRHEAEMSELRRRLADAADGYSPDNPI